MSSPLPRTHHGQVLAIVVLLFALVGCAAADDGAVEVGETTPAGAGAAGSTEAPTDDVQPEDASPAAPVAGTAEAFVGTLGGSSIEGGCIWLDADDGTRYELIAAPGAAIAIDPANRVIADTTGTVIASEGEEIMVEGEIDPEILSFCQVGTILVVSDASTG